ncbi:MAG: DUF2157 domain-containing protein [bacterium]|nr:DUF2157 domain-containing protein [bacterium]
MFSPLSTNRRAPSGNADEGSPASREAAQQAVERIQAFRRELAHLADREVLHLSVEQQQAVEAYHQGRLEEWRLLFDVDTHSQGRQFSQGMKIASFLAALGLGAAVFFLFHRFWGYFSIIWQAGLLIAASIGTLLAAMHCAARERQVYFAKLFGLVALTCFVLNLVLLGQLFNVTPSPKVLLAWAAFAFSLAYATEARLLLAAAILCLAGFLSAQSGTWSGMYWLSVGEQPESYFPAAVLLFALSFLPHRLYPAFPPMYRVWALLFWFVPVLVLSHWGSGSLLPLPSRQVEWLYQVAGFAGSAGVITAGIRRHWPETVQTGLIFFTLFLYTKFYDWWWDWMPKYLFFALAGLAAVLVLLILQRLRGRSLGSRGGVSSNASVPENGVVG